ncbi:uncharacterized protein I303_103366 [Kwoniella dejecticola CBS 10117]|uniref:UDP-N-acetylglucosamine transferase subunit ALG13 n=1 Tax=Kwoniella dejecticola CBS 10117 TaxID=1296121 RepID=A0A1A6A6J7_9TREE|nr:uncharacterized protein I303_03389 [Kwoniella dejecticola CBS 10117]OBR85678.1 hypothetical protein I303_03389 [Kwoniella dejecticola CBS 10117]
MSSVLVTVGSTLFPALTNKIFSPEIISIFHSNGVERLVVQYGRADVPISLLRARNLKLDGQGKASIMIGQGEEKGEGGLKVDLFRFTDEFEGLVRSCEYVISHAGSGSILTALRMTPPKKLLVVPNESLMDNHQAELANKMSEEGYLMLSNVEDLANTLPSFLNPNPHLDVDVKKEDEERFKLFPQMDRGRFKSILDDTMGYE